MQRALDGLHRDDPAFPQGVAVHLDELLQAFITGLETFRAGVEASPQKKALVTERAGKVPVWWSSEVVHNST
jgi:hypothetical protein